MRVRLEKLQKRKLHWSKQKKNSQSNHCCKVSCGFDYQVTKCTDLVRISSKRLQLGLSRWTYYYAYRQEVEKMNPENKKRCQSTLVKQKDLLRLSQRPSKGWGDPLKVLAKLTNHIGSSFDMSDSPTANQKKDRHNECPLRYRCRTSKMRALDCVKWKFLHSSLCDLLTWFFFFIIFSVL